MSTKKEKCCGCPEEQDICRGECMCHHSQSESIEREREFDELTKSMDGQFRPKLRLLFRKAITTAVDKRDALFVSEVQDIQTMLHNGLYEEGYRLTNKLLSNLKH